MSQEDNSQVKKEDETLSNLSSGDTQQGGIESQDDIKLQLERSASLPVDNQPDLSREPKIKESKKKFDSRSIVWSIGGYIITWLISTPPLSYFNKPFLWSFLIGIVGLVIGFSLDQYYKRKEVNNE